MKKLLTFTALALALLAPARAQVVINGANLKAGTVPTSALAANSGHAAHTIYETYIGSQNLTVIDQKDNLWVMTAVANQGINIPAAIFTGGMTLSSGTTFSAVYGSSILLGGNVVIGGTTQPTPLFLMDEGNSLHNLRVDASNNLILDAMPFYNSGSNMLLVNTSGTAAGLGGNNRVPDGSSGVLTLANRLVISGSTFSGSSTPAGNGTIALTLNTGNNTFPDGTSGVNVLVNAIKFTGSLTGTGTASGNGTVNIATSGGFTLGIDSNSQINAATDNTNGVSALGLRYAQGNMRNALAPRGGVYFNGSASAGITSPLTNQNITTDPLSISIIFKVPDNNPASTEGLFSLSSSNVTGTQANALIGFIDTSSVFHTQLFAADGTSYTGITLSLATWAGKRVHLVFTRSTTTVALYINGVAQTTGTESGGAPPTWAGSITSNYFNVGFLAAATPFVGTIYSATFYNLALAATDVLEVLELGGSVPERFKYGSEALLNTATLVDIHSSFSSVSATATSFSGVVPNGAYSAIAVRPYLPSSGQVAAQWKVVFNYTGVASPLLRLAAQRNVSSVTGAGQVTTPAAGLNTYIVGNDNKADAIDLEIQAAFAAINGSTISFTGLTVQQIGAVVHLMLDDGIGYQIADASTNSLDATITTTGCSHVIGRTRGVLHFVTTAGTVASNTQILGQQALPANSRIMSWVIDSSGSATVSLGNVSAGAQFLSAGSITSGLNEVTLLTRYDSTNNLWCNASTSSGTTTLTHTIYYESIR